MTVLRLADVGTATDLATFVARAKRVDPDGAARLLGAGAVLAVYVSPVHGTGAPTVLGLRTLGLRAPADVDVVVPLAALSDRLARPTEAAELAVPPAEATGVSWAGVSPPRGGWTPLGSVTAGVLAVAAHAGVSEVAAGAGPAAGAPAVAQLRAGVWGRAIPGTPDLPAGVAFAAESLGFLGAEDVEVFSAGPWWRATTLRGHVLARQPLLG
ncbi:MAG TPA: hypothetical protein VFD41_12315 [Actinomycetales bacterium]|nr:hypothetical protein [Actinomycetales bacterium]